MSAVRIGVDVGGTKIEAIALDAGGHALVRRRVPTPAGDYDGVVAGLCDLVLGIEREIGQEASVGIGTPGSVSLVTGRLRNSNSAPLNGRRFADDVGAALGRPVRIANDADCFTLSEAADGAGAGHRVVFGVILGTGVGGGIVACGRLWTGRNGVAGEWGHNALPRRGSSQNGDRNGDGDGGGGGGGDDEDDGDLRLPRCYCGRRGCIESYLSGPAIAADHARHGGGTLAAATIAARAAAGEPASQGTMERFQGRLARALASVVNLLDPDVIVLGGGLSNVDEIYRRVPALMAQHVFSDSFTTPVCKHLHGDSSGVRGAARLWP